MTRFNVTFAVDDMDGLAVMVFLKPQNSQLDSHIHAWQKLTGSVTATCSHSLKTGSRASRYSAGCF